MAIHNQIIAERIRSLAPMFRDLSLEDAQKIAFEQALPYVRGKPTTRDLLDIFLLQVFAAKKMSPKARMYCAKACYHGVGVRKSESPTLRYI